MHSYKIAHCDIKPENIMVNVLSNKIKYIDFGGSCIDTECRHHAHTKMYADPNYVNLYGYKSFSKIKDKEILYLTQQSDLWSLGIVIYEMIMKTTPVLMYSTCEEYFENYSYKNDPNRKIINKFLSDKNCNVNLDDLLSKYDRSYACNC